MFICHFVSLTHNIDHTTDKTDIELQWTARRLFIKELGKKLIMPHMKGRMEGTPHLQTHITEAMGRCVLRKINAATTQPQEDIRQEGQVKRKSCKICPAAKDRKASSWCSKCTSPVCKEHKHVIVICEACMHWDGNLHWTHMSVFNQVSFLLFIHFIHSPEFTTVQYQFYQLYGMC